MVNGLGDPAAVAGYADDLLRGSGVAGNTHGLVEGARPQRWEGAASDAFVEAAKATLPTAQKLADTLRAGSGILARYAEVQSRAVSGFDEAQREFDRAARAVRSNPLDLPAMLDLAQARFAALGAVGQLQQAAATAASELRTAAGLEGDARPWWDPFGWWTDPEEPDERVGDDILDDDAFDPDDVAQGSIGDCFMLSSVVSLLSTDGGDDFIRENIRWDEDRQGYWVTIYPNGEAKEIFVEYVFDNGARNKDWQGVPFGPSSPSIAALYEAAIREEYGYDFLEGGVPEDAMRIITGETPIVVENDNHAGLADWQLEGARDALDDGGQVVISSPRDPGHHITVTAPDGSTRDIEVVPTHSYAVTRIEADGSVWMRNPWGPANWYDGGGEFRVSAEDVSDLFWRVTYADVTG